MPLLETVSSLHDLRLSHRRMESFGLTSRKSEIERFLYIHAAARESPSQLSPLLNGLKKDCVSKTCLKSRWYGVFFCNLGSHRDSSFSLGRVR